MSECAYRLLPRMPREIYVPKSTEQVRSPMMQWLQPRVFDTPLSGEPADDKLAVTANGDRKRIGPRTDALQQIFQGGDHGVELGLIIGHVVPELDLARGDGPIRPSNFIAAVPLAGVAKRSAVEENRVIGSRNGTYRVQAHVTCGRAGCRRLPPSAGQCALQIVHEVDQLLVRQRLRVDVQQPIDVPIAPIVLVHAWAASACLAAAALTWSAICAGTG